MLLILNKTVVRQYLIYCNRRFSTTYVKIERNVFLNLNGLVYRIVESVRVLYRYNIKAYDITVIMRILLNGGI